jgi:hypothetical protein
VVAADAAAGMMASMATAMMPMMTLRICVSSFVGRGAVIGDTPTKTPWRSGRYTRSRECRGITVRPTGNYGDCPRPRSEARVGVRASSRRPGVLAGRWVVRRRYSPESDLPPQHVEPLRAAHIYPSECSPELDQSHVQTASTTPKIPLAERLNVPALR